MLIHKETKSILLRVKNLNKLNEFFPDRYELVDFKGHNVSIPHGLEETKILNNLGVQVPSPILYYYNWPGPFPAWDHQKYTAAQLTLNRRMYVLNEAGTAKTASSLWAADYLMQQGMVRKCLIACMLSTVESVWMDEIFSFLMHRTSSLLVGDRKKRLANLEKDVDFYVINHDGVEVISKELKARKDIDLLILDEASVYINARTTMYKKMCELIRPDMAFWPMTATPTPNAPTDAWALARMTTPSNVTPYFGSFRDLTMRQISQFKWVERENAHETVFKALQPAVRFKKSDCIDLPPVVFKSRRCDLSDEQKKLFTDMRNKDVLQAKSGEKISAINAADKLNKIRQLLCGVIKQTETGVYVPLDFRPRLQLLIESIDEAHAKVLVIVPFKGIIYELQKHLHKIYSCAVINGDVTPRRRREIIKAFKTSKDPHVLLCHPKVMAHGLNLTEADTLIFYGPINSNDEAMQVVERFNRKGQTRKMTVVKFSSHFIEDRIYKNIETKQLGQDKTLSLYNDYLRGEDDGKS